MTNEEIKIREVTTVEEFTQCVILQKEVFGWTDLETSPIRHLIITKNAGGFTLGAFVEGKLVGFVLSIPGFNGADRFFYSHVTAVKNEFQNYGIGGKLKWAQRDYSLARGVNFIKWTFQPVLARNAFFNIEKLGADIKEYKPDFYTWDNSFSREKDKKSGLNVDRVFAEWYLESEKVIKLAKGESFEETGKIVRKIKIPNDWNNLVNTRPQKAFIEKERIKTEFQNAFAQGFVCRAFERSEMNPKYILFGK